MTEVRKSVLRSVRLDDDVWDAVKGMECSLNQYLREALVVNGNVEAVPVDPVGIPGVSRGVASLPVRPEGAREKFLDRISREKAEKEARIRARSSIGDDPSFVADPEYSQD